jgi:ATP-dependent Zn protease
VPNEDGSLGFAAWQEDESKHTYSAEDYKKLIMVSLTGREGEKLCPGAGADAINTGVSSDYERATHRAWQYLSRFGFNEEVGVFCLGGIPEAQRSELSSQFKPRIDALLAECLSATTILLREKLPQIEAHSKALLAKEALDGQKVEKVLIDRNAQQQSTYQ